MRESPRPTSLLDLEVLGLLAAPLDYRDTACLRVDGRCRYDEISTLYFYYYANLHSPVLAGLIVGYQSAWLERHVVVTQKMSQVILTLCTAYFALSIATSLATTLLITVRILLVQRAARLAGAEGSRYGAVVEILVESAVI